MHDKMLFPHFSIEQLKVIDGTIIDAPRFCKNRLRKDKDKCLNFHLNFTLEGKFEFCPYGFACYNFSKIQYSSLVTVECDYKNVYPKAPDHKILDTQYIIETIKKDNTSQNITDALTDTLHDVKKLNGYILDIVEQSSKYEFNGDLESIKQWSLLMKSRLALYDLSNNNLLLKQGKKVDKHIFKLFDAIKKSFESILIGIDKRIRIYADNRLEYLCNVYDSFSLLPFIILDNAIKYSPKDGLIEIIFKLNSKTLQVFVKSIGPDPNVDNIDKLFERGFRSQNPNVIIKTGSGLGLAIAKSICDTNEVKISIKLEPLYSNNFTNDNNDCFFIVILEFDRKKLKLINKK